MNIHKTLWILEYKIDHLISKFRIAIKKPLRWHILSILKKVKLDKWYATRVLGWELEEDGEDYKFHVKSEDVILPSDY